MLSQDDSMIGGPQHLRYSATGGIWPVTKHTGCKTPSSIEVTSVDSSGRLLAGRLATAEEAQAKIEAEVKALMLPMQGDPNKPIGTVITLARRVTPYIKQPWGASLAVQKILPLIRSKIKSFEKNTLQGTPSEIARLLTAYNEMLLALGSSEPPVKDRPVDLLAAYNRLKGFPEDGPKRFTLIRLALGLEIVHKTTAAEAKTENNRFLKDELLLFVRQLKKDNVIPGTVYAIEFCELITDIYDRANQGAEGIEHLRALDKVYGFKKPNRAVFDELIKCLQPEEAA